MENIPEPDCNTAESGRACDKWKEFPDLGIAGWAGNDTGGYFVQVKNPPEDEEGLEALKQTLLPCYDRIGQCTHPDGSQFRRTSTTSITVIPVKYDYGELHRWTVILNRFARSPGNTIGLHGARLHINKVGYPTA